MANYDLDYEGSVVQDILDTGKSLEDDGYIFLGTATPSTIPGTPIERVAYVGGPGTYNNFGTTIVVPSGSIVAITYSGSAWSKTVINASLPVSTTLENNDTTIPTGKAVKTAIDAINTKLGEGYIYAGIATASTNPGTPTGKVFYLARQAGTYTNFGGLTLTEGVNILKYNGTAWSQEQLISIADIYKNPLMGYYECDTAGATAAKTVAATGYVLPATGGSVKIKMANRNTAANATLNINSTGAKPLIYNGQRAGVGNTWDTNEIVEVFYDGTNYQAYNVAGSNGDGVFDISAYNLTDGQPTPYVDLAAALGTDGVNIPESIHKGGMSVKFIQGSVPSSDNKYVQYRLMAQSFTTDVSQWQGVDDKPIGGSHNLIESGSVAKYALEFPKPTPDPTIEWNLRYAKTLVEKQFLINKVYKLTLSLKGCNETDISKLLSLDFAVENSQSSIVHSYLFTESDKIKLETDGYCDITYYPLVSTSYVGTHFGDSHAPGQTKYADLVVLELIDANEAFNGIINGNYADGSVLVNSNRLATNKAIYRASVFNEEVASATFTMTERYKTDIAFPVSIDNNYYISIGVSGLSSTDIDNLQRIRLATGTAVGDYVYEYRFTNEDKNALKQDAICYIPSYVAQYNTSHIHLYFESGYTPTSGNSFTIKAVQQLTCNEVTHKVNNGVFADKTPVKNSNRLITSGAAFNVTHLVKKDGEVSFVMEGRYNLRIQLLLHEGRTYELKLSVEGLSNTDIDNLRLLRTATGIRAGDYVFSHTFTEDDKASLKNDGYCLIPYSAEQDTYYIHFYFIEGYTPTEGNELTIEAYSQYSLIEAFNQEVKATVNNFLEGKTCVCIGDSITEFAGRGEGIEPKRYSDYLEEYCNLTAINIGIGGTCLRERHDPVIDPQEPYSNNSYAALDMINIVRAACGVMYDANTSYLELAQAAAIYIRDNKPTHDDNTAQIERLQAIDWSKVDYVTVLGGSNDWHGGAVLGESGSTDTTRTLGAVNEIIRLLLTTYPHITLIWITPPVRWIDYNGTEESKIPANFSDYYKIRNLTLKEFSNSIKNEVGLNHIPVFDFYNEIGWNMYNFAQYYGDNETHPFRGNAYIARKLANFLYSH